MQVDALLMAIDEMQIGQGEKSFRGTESSGVIYKNEKCVHQNHTCVQFWPPMLRLSSDSVCGHLGLHIEKILAWLTVIVLSTYAIYVCSFFFPAFLGYGLYFF